jgi:hypothetical protein
MDIDRYPEVRLADLSRITHAYHLVTPPESAAGETLIIRFAGVYGVGSKGNSDAAYMKAVATAGLAAWGPSLLVFDFRELDYSWGDMLDPVLRAV